MLLLLLLLLLPLMLVLRFTSSIRLWLQDGRLKILGLNFAFAHSLPSFGHTQLKWQQQQQRHLKQYVLSYKISTTKAQMFIVHHSLLTRFLACSLAHSRSCSLKNGRLLSFWRAPIAEHQLRALTNPTSNPTSNPTFKPTCKPTQPAQAYKHTH